MGDQSTKSSGVGVVSSTSSTRVELAREPEKTSSENPTPVSLSATLPPAEPMVALTRLPEPRGQLMLGGEHARRLHGQPGSTAGASAGQSTGSSFPTCSDDPPAYGGAPPGAGW